MSHKLLLYIFVLGLVLTSSCSNDINTKKNSSYDILEEEKLETSNKAQLEEYVVYKDSNFTKEALENILMEIYNEHSGKDLFKNFDNATVFGAYLYTSKEALEHDKGSWIGMLSKGPLDSKPEVSYNELKIQSLQGLYDNEKSKDEIALENLNEYLKIRGLELCSLSKQIDEIELDCIHKADKKYPDFGTEHSKYVKDLMKKERGRLVQQYELHDSVFTKIGVFAMAYCK